MCYLHQPSFKLETSYCHTELFILISKLDNFNSSLFQNNIPVFCPAITDGAIGDNLYFFSYKSPGLKLDIVEGNFGFSVY